MQIQLVYRIGFIAWKGMKIGTSLLGFCRNSRKFSLFPSIFQISYFPEKGIFVYFGNWFYFKKSPHQG